MKLCKPKYLITILSSLFATIIYLNANAGITNTSHTINSLSISSNQSENSYQYLIEIDLKGIDVSNVTFEVEFQTLYLLASKGSAVSDIALSGAQIMRLAYDFPTNVNLKRYFRINHPNKIIISIPKI